MASVQDIFGYRVPKIVGTKTETSKAVGIEVELERVYTLDAVTPWNIVDDGSLKDNGREFTLAVWHDNAKEYLDYLFKHIRKPKISSRCSVHIHANVCDFTEVQLKTLIVLYIIYEEALYNFSGRRWNSNFCVPVRTHLTTDLKNIDFSNMSYVFPKYSGLHFFPDDKLGTVEFRHMAGTTNIDYIVDWINIITALTSYAKETDYTHLINRINNMYSDSSYWELAKEIFGDYYKVINYNDFKESAEHGILLVKLLSEE